MKDGRLAFTLQPKLADWLFDENGEAGFTLLSRCQVVYKNPAKKNTFGSDGVAVAQMKLIFADGSEETVEGNCITGEDAMKLRDGSIVKIEASCR